MRAHRTMLIVLVLLTATTVGAQAQAIEDVLTRVPGDCVGFLAVKSVGNTAAGITRLANDVTMGQVPVSPLAMVKAEMQLGPALNDNGGFALILLDPAKFGLTFEMFLDGPSSGPPPFAILIPGNEAEAIFAAYAPQVADGYVVFDVGGPLVYAKPMGGYTVLGLSPEWVNAVIAAPTAAAQTIPAPHRDMYAANEAVLYVDMKKVAPLLVAGITEGEQAMQNVAQGPMMDPSTRAVIGMYAGMLPMLKDMVGQTGAATLAVSLNPSAVLCDSLVTFAADSEVGKALATIKPVPALTFDRLPGLPYVLAAGGDWGEDSGEMAALQQQMAAAMMQSMMTAGADTGLTPAQAERFLALTESMNRQILRMQMYMGPPPADSGLFSFGGVLEVRDAAAMMAMMPEIIELNMAFTKGLMADAPDVPMADMRYVKNAGTIEGISIDTIEIDTPLPAGLPPEAVDQAAMMIGMIYGDSQLQLRMAPISNDRIVMTFGGGEGFMTEAIKAARTGDGLAKDPSIAAGMALLPRKPMGVAMVNAANILALARNGLATMGPGMTNPIMDALYVGTKTPLVYGMSIKGPGVYQAVAIPNTLLADIYKNVMMVQMMQAQQRSAAQEQQPDDGKF